MIEPQYIQAGNVKLCLDNFVAENNGSKIVLTKAEYIIVSTLAKNAGSVVSREELVRRINPVETIKTQAINVHIHRLRKALDWDVDTASKAGYCVRKSGEPQ